MNGSGSSAAPTGPSSTNSPSRPGEPGDLAPLSDLELRTIRARALGQRLDPKKRREKLEGNKKFVFDWKPEEDTSGFNPNFTVDAQGFGPGGTMLGGNLAGLDAHSSNKDGTPDQYVFINSLEHC